MRIILKIIAAPLVLALTLTVGVLSFIFSLASWAFNILCLLCAVTALFAWFVGGDAFWGVRGSDHRVLRFSLWPACRGRVADLQAGRAQLLFEMLYHGLITLGHFVPKQRGGGYA